MALSCGVRNASMASSFAGWIDGADDRSSMTRHVRSASEYTRYLSALAPTTYLRGGPLFLAAGWSGRRRPPKASA
jgi:hypothetical protein